ncbi:MAG TPA: glycosyltransferase, partial [Bacteroidia bacterium]
IARLMRRKGIYIAAQIANTTGIPLKIVGQGGVVTEKGSLIHRKNSDFELEAGNWEYLGYADVETRKKLYANARATIVATQYLEPFAGTHVESMLSGTPVITTSFGVFPETIPDVLQGVVGYRCWTFDDFYQAAMNVHKLDPFTIQNYASRYLMDNVKWQYQKWFEDLHRVYESRDGISKGWNYFEQT